VLPWLQPTRLINKNKKHTMKQTEIRTLYLVA
jgi:hypothetical protein